MEELFSQIEIDWSHVWQLLLNWYWLPLFVLYFGVISTILIENRNPTKTISWVMVIVFLPFVGLILYYLFGQKFRKVKRFQRINREQNRKLLVAWEESLSRMDEQLEIIHQRIGMLSRVFDYLKNEKLAFFSLNNRVELFINGEEKFPVLLKRLREAKKSIHMEYYIFEFDHIGKQVLAILEEKAKEGVKVRLILDSIGSPQVIKYLRKNKPSYPFEAFLPVTFTSLANSNYRNHRKIVVIDCQYGFVGGINISDRYINQPNQANYWRDTAMAVEGIAVNNLQIQFWNSWNQTEGEPFSLTEEYLNFNVAHIPERAAVSFASSDPGSLGPFNMEAILLAINDAKERIQLCTPYFIPSEQLSTALEIAASSGIKVELMLPAVSDSYIVQHATFSFLKPLLQRGIHVYLYNKGFIHAKTVCIDGKLAFVGTVNLDIRSFYINYEITSVVSDEQYCKRLEQQFEMDKSASDLVTLFSWAHRKKWKKGVDSLCRLLAPLL
ncbi:cardiolipin synthase [Sphingobacterium sp. SRCM116780]|uniref:cardiolipin synthase n=1 Tax=Sphingobacterium sp. SRCM116780 TaxID=2907623 RepID=UPI001F23AEEF|nr:cardiolipin synthase [Sphingobacterium sp. SRCM116780]UIR56619.1 cardiolipin synthase [Sphingobacterium sp. SRCM116780]